jgi:hypothetical protein
MPKDQRKVEFGQVGCSMPFRRGDYQDKSLDIIEIYQRMGWRKVVCKG